MEPDSTFGGADAWHGFDRIASKVLAKVYPGVPSSIDPDDDMLNYSIANLGRSATDAWTEYFIVGRHILDTITQILHWAGRDWNEIGAALDFAAGYGRSARFMREVLEPDAVWVSDILESAVEFQTSHFGVQGFVSDVDPDRVEMPCEFDLISVISLFTHLPEPTFRKWLAKLCGSLAPNGIMVFTSHGMRLLNESGGTICADRFHFQNHSESSILDSAAYGSTRCTREFIEDVVRDLPGVALLAHIPSGLNGHQDVNIIGKGVAPPLAPCVIPHAPQRLNIDVADLDATSTLRLEGWALDASLAPVERVEVLVDGESAGTADLHVKRPDVAEHFGDPRAADGGWRFEAVSVNPKPNWLTVIAQSVGGARNFTVFSLPQV